MSAGIEAGNPPLLPLSTTAPSFEFGKRKRWADLVVTELVDVLLLVLSPQGKVMYCGTGLKGLLGWKDSDIIDFDFADLLNADDREGFMLDFETSLRTGADLPSSYVRIRCAPSTLSDPPTSEELLFELKGRPQITTDADDATAPVQVFFVVAKPHPNKSVEMLNTFIDLQEEHERLQHRVAELRARAPRRSAPSSPTSSTASASSMYATTSMVPKHPVSQSPQANTTSPSIADDVSPSPTASSYDGNAASGKTEDGDDALKKKKQAKKAQPVEQYVCITCGRTDSPEWRKGPLGPKTLCNACGLRWAKQTKVQKLTDDAEAPSAS
ncbi:hypothetical protein B0H10DRAFT_2028341 [Mycena sp. CBHHK59/15]|nr:hypothetical protein B0H10DRAFT_2028341 [Mycena sp. CBHHK59/15]